MTLFLGVDQLSAQGINLLYFLPTAAMALAEHKKNGLLEPSLLRSAIPWALPVTRPGRLGRHRRGCGGAEKAFRRISPGVRALYRFQ